MAGGRRRWDIFPMASNSDKKAAAELRARALHARLMALPRPREDYSNNDWTAEAGVSTSFFTNMQGRSKPASEPSVGNLRLVLEAVGSTLPEFFADEAQGRLIARPTRQELEQAIADALPGLPKQADKRPGYLAEAVLNVLALPKSRPATAESGDRPAADDPATAAPPPASTRRAGSAR